MSIIMIAVCFPGCAKKSEPQLNDSKTAAQESLLDHQTDTEASSAKRNSINVGIQSDPADFAPWGANTTGRISALWGIYEPLADFYDGEAAGVLMKDYRISADDLTVSITLYDYIVDSAGNKLTADDVKFSFEKGTELGLISGLSIVEDIVVTGEYTFDFILARKLSVGELQTLLESWFVVTRASYEAAGDGMASQPVGTGPYVMTRYTSNYMFTYVAGDYWQTENANPRAMQNVQEINYYIISEASQRTTALETGQIDVCDCISDDDLYMFEEGGALADRYWVYSNPDFRSLFVFPNLMEGTKTAGDINLRNAILYAIDAEAVCESVFGGRANVNHSFSPDWGIGYVDSWSTDDNYYNSAGMDQAKEYLAQSDYDGEPLILLTETTSMVSDTAQIVQSFLIEAGMKAEIQTVESSVLRSYMQTGDWDILVTRNGITTYAISGFRNVLDPTKWPNGSVNNVSDSYMHELLDIAFHIETASDETMDQLHRYITEKAYGRCLCNYYLSFVVPKDMTGVTISWRNSIMPGGCTYSE